MVFKWFALSFILAVPAFGALRIVQSISSEVSAPQSAPKTSQLTHEWTIHDGLFHLKITPQSSQQKSEVTQYIFNGKTFYICGRLPTKTLQRLENQFQKKDLLKKFSQGACQVVPSSFLVRFFLSPLASAEAVDHADGLTLNMSLPLYSVQKSKRCEGYTKNMELLKSTKTQTLKSKVEEDLCYDSTTLWKDRLQKEVRKVLTRQIKSSDLLDKLRPEFDKPQGFALEGRLNQSFSPKEGVTYSMSHTIKLVKKETIETDSRTFKLPTGYALFAPDALTLPDEDTSKKTQPVAPQKDGTLMEIIQSTFFCSLAMGICI